MFCPFCGAKYLDTRGTCQTCGRQAPELPGEIRTALDGSLEAGNCPGCGVALVGGEVFCGECGMHLQALPVSSSEGYLAPSSSPRNLVGYAPSFITEQQNIEREEGSTDDQVLAGENRRVLPSYLSMPITGASDRINRLDRKGLELAFSLNGFRNSPETGIRSRIALIISLACFTASLLSAATAIWLALSQSP